MKRVRLLILLPLIVILSFTNVGYVMPQEESMEFELKELRTPNAKAFRQPDGTVLWKIYPSDIHYKDENGNFEEIDLAVVDNTDDKLNDGYKYKNGANSWSVYFADIRSNEDYITIMNKDAGVGIRAVSANDISKVIKTKDLAQAESQYQDAAIGNNNMVAYLNVFDGADLYYTILDDCLKEDIVIREYSGQNTFQFDLSVNGLEMSEEETGYTFINKNGVKSLFIAKNSFMFDGNGKYSEGVSCAAEHISEDLVRLTVTADREFLESSDTVFPVVIDPTYTISGGSVTYDSYVSSANPGTNYYLNNYLRTGRDTTYGIRRTYIKFDLSSVEITSPLVSAKLKLTKYTSAGTLSMRAKKCDSGWQSSTITWNNMPSGTSVSTTTTVNGSVYTMNFGAPSFISNWLSYPSTNYGFIIYDYVENDNNVWGTFYSSDYGTAAYRPVLEIVTGYPSQYVDLAITCDGAYRYGNSDWSTDAHDVVEEADDALSDNFGIDFYYKTYVAWSSPADSCPDDPQPCKCCSCPANCPNCETACSEHGCAFAFFYGPHCPCQFYGNCAYFHNEGYNLLDDAYENIGSRDAVVALSKNSVFLFDDYMQYKNVKGLAHGYGYDPVCIYRSASIPNYSDGICVRHEFSHLYGCPDHDNSENCIMYYYLYNGIFYFGSTTNWCQSCKDIIVSHRTEIGSPNP